MSCASPANSFIEVAAQPDSHAPPDLRNLQRVRQSGARRITFPRPHDLRLVCEPTQRGAMQNSGSVPGEVGTVLTLGTWQPGSLRRFANPPLAVEVAVGVVLIRDHRPTVCPAGRRTDRPTQMGAAYIYMVALPRAVSYTTLDRGWWRARLPVCALFACSV